MHPQTRAVLMRSASLLHDNANNLAALGSHGEPDDLKPELRAELDALETIIFGLRAALIINEAPLMQISA